MRSSLLCIVSGLFLCGCAVHRPLLVPDQAKLIDHQASQLKSLAQSVQDRITASGTTAALIVIFGDANSTPEIYPTSDPTVTAVQHLQDLQKGSSCFVVFSRALPIQPEERSCAALAAEAKRFLDDQEWKRNYESHLTEAQNSITALRGDLIALRGDVAQLSHEIKLEQAKIDQDEKALDRNSSDIESMGKVFAPMSGLVQFHEVQLRKAEQLLGQLTMQYGKTAEVVGKNNDQIESMIKDLNSAFAQVQTSINDMQQKLATIH